MSRQAQCQEPIGFGESLDVYIHGNSARGIFFVDEIRMHVVFRIRSSRLRSRMVTVAVARKIGNKIRVQVAGTPLARRL
jgi:hypothetical protein